MRHATTERRNGRKWCSKHLRWLPLGAFTRPNRKTADGLSSWCDEHHRQAVRDWKVRQRANDHEEEDDG